MKARFAYSAGQLVTLPKDEFVRLEVLTVLGEKVATLVNENRQAGYHSVVFDASNLSSGIYFYWMTAGQFTEMKQLSLVK